MNNKNIVALSDEELENISGGVTGKQVLGGFVEGTITAVSMYALGTIGKLLGGGIVNVSTGNDFTEGFNEPLLYRPGISLASEIAQILEDIDENRSRPLALKGIPVVLGEGGGWAGGYFAGRAIGKIVRKKLGL